MINYPLRSKYRSQDEEFFMTIQLRQICLVAHKLEPVIEDLTDILGINRCFVDPGVGKIGLENTLMPVCIVVEVVALR